MVVRQALMLSGTGVAVGLVAATLFSRVPGSLLNGLDSVDPLTYITLAVALHRRGRAREPGPYPRRTLRAE